MAAEKELTDRQIVRLADTISSNSMKKIAHGYLQFGMEEIISIKDDNQGNGEAFVRDVLRKWARQSSTTDKVKVNLFSYPMNYELSMLYWFVIHLVSSTSFNVV